MGFLDLVALNCITNLSRNIGVNFSSKVIYKVFLWVWTIEQSLM